MQYKFRGKMNIQLDPNHRLTTDKHNYIIEEKRVYEKGKNIGEIYWKPILFYPFLHQAVAGYSERFLREADLDTLQALNEAVRGLSELVRDVKGVCV